MILQVYFDPHASSFEELLSAAWRRGCQYFLDGQTLYLFTGDRCTEYKALGVFPERDIDVNPHIRKKDK